MRYSISYADGVAEFRCSREFTYEDAIQGQTEVVEAEWLPELERLLVLDEGSALSPTREGFRELTRLMDRMLEKESVKIGIVVAKIVHYGIGQILEARSGQGGGRVRVFLREEAARQWMGLPAEGTLSGESG